MIRAEVASTPEPDHASSVLQQINATDITVVDGQVHIRGQKFRNATCILGGGPGLEALHAAAKNPDAAIVVIDPLTVFADKTFGYLAGREGKNQEGTAKGLAKIIANQETTIGLHEFKPTGPASQRIAQEFAGYAPKFPELNSRIFWIGQPFQQVTEQLPEQCFSKIAWILPYNSQAESLFAVSKLCTRLEEKGELLCLTDCGYLAFLLRQVLKGQSLRISKGALAETASSDHERPISVYDAVLRSSDSKRELLILTSSNGQMDLSQKVFYLLMLMGGPILSAWIELIEDNLQQLMRRRQQGLVPTAQQAFDRIFN